MEMKQLQYIIEYFIILLIFGFFRIFSFRAASNIGGFLAKIIGPLLKNDYKKAERQLSFVFPHFTSKQKRFIIRQMYENIGRFIAEYINQHKIDKKYVEANVVFKDEQNWIQYVKEGCFFATGHFGNWELLQRFIDLKNIPISVIYKPIANPFINRLYLNQRNVRQIPKGNNTIKDLLSLIKERGTLGILIDQREKTGDVFEFLGKPARTSTVIQRLSVKFDYKIILVKCVRFKNNPNKFIIECFPPITIENSGNIEADTRKLTDKTLRILEEWIKEEPQNWMLWLYSRWKINF